jgi:hypothetical protein
MTTGPGIDHTASRSWPMADKLWAGGRTEPNEWHVFPLDDLIGHELAGTGCVCGTKVEPLVDATGAETWLIVHHSLDGREQQENPGQETEQ